MSAMLTFRLSRTNPMSCSQFHHSLARSLSSTSFLPASKGAEINEKNPKQQSSVSDESPPNPPEKSSTPNKAKTVSQTDAELRERLEKMSGEGGAAGIEYEDGKPNAMKRSVRNNMFRLI